MAVQQQAHDKQQLLQLPAVAAEAAALLEHELTAQQPSVAKASMIMGILQERLFSSSEEPITLTVESYMVRFHEQLVAPAAAKLGPKLKTPQDKVIAIAKFLRGKLAKAPAHKQPLHTQYLPSALHDAGKRQLDCLGIATAVLGLCHAIGAHHSTQHADLAASRMVVSDDHCWLALPQQQQQQPATVSGGSMNKQRQQQGQQDALLHVEVTDPRVLAADKRSNWLFAGGHGGQQCTTQQVIMILVAGLMPEELKDAAAAAAVAAVQMGLLQQLAARHPSALVYSNFFRWGMLHEELELRQLVAAAESGNIGDLQQLARLSAQQLHSQQCYAESIQRSTGMQWHPHSCAAFGWLNRMQAALCGDTDKLLALSSSWQQKAASVSSSAVGKDLVQEQQKAGNAAPAVSESNRSISQMQQQLQQLQQQQLEATNTSAAVTWLQIGTFLFEQSLLSLDGCAAVLRKYALCAGKPDKAADKQLMEAIRDLWQNLADACKAVACLQQVAAKEASQVQQQEQVGQQVQRIERTATAAQHLAAPVQHGSSRAGAAAGQEEGQSGGHLAADVPATAAVTAHNAHLAAAVSSLQLSGSITAGIANSSWLQPLLNFMDAICAYFGDESADLPAECVADFIVAAGTFTSAARAEAGRVAAAAQQLQSSRVKALAVVGSAAACAWEELGVELQQLLQMPGSRKRKRKEL